MKFKTRPSERPQINVTPLIDVILQLVIFFMLTSSFVVQPGLRIQLPEVGEKSSEEERGRSVLITKDEAIYFEKGRVTLDELEQALARIQTKELLIVRADRDARHGLVVTVMDLAKQAGFTRLAIATSPREGP